MRPKRKITPAKVRKWLVLACTAFFMLGGISGYFIGKASAAAKNEPITTTQTAPAEAKAEKPIIESLGEFTLTAYCSCEKCCGKNDGITATGEKVQQGETIAVDPNVIPYGTKLIVNGEEYTAQDTMSPIIIEKYSGRIIDIYFNSHTEALEFGVQTAEIFVKS